MTSGWAVRIDVASAASLGRLRCRGGLEVLECESQVWLRGPACGDPREDELECPVDEALDLELRCLPGAARFSVRDDGQLLPHGRRVPQGRLPEGPWAPLSEWLEVELPLAALAGQLPARAALTMRRAASAAEPNVLLATLEDWSRFGETAAQVRLAPLAFAVSEEGRVVVRGTPLPPVRGRPYVEQGGVAVEAGWTWSPPLDAAVLRAAFGLEAGDLALLHRDGSWDRLQGDDFVRAARSAIRLTRSAGAERRGEE